MMDLEKTYYEINEKLKTIDFEKLWEGFKPLKFALYNDSSCFFDGKYIEKTDEFCANTAIFYQGEMIAIWNVMEEMDINVFTSKIVHEMFHGYQEMNNWDSFPNETEALFKYQYDEENLSLKLYENELLINLLDKFNKDDYYKLLEIRKYRKNKFPYQFDYESKVEEIEGSANFVEWRVLKLLDEEKSKELENTIKNDIIDPNHLFPIRIVSYYIGMLLINAFVSAKDYEYNTNKRPFINTILDKIELKEIDNNKYLSIVRDKINSFNQETKDIIEKAVENNEVVLSGPYEIGFVNIYNARCYNNYITSTYFVMYLDNKEQKFIYGNFVLKMKDEKTIDKIYKWV